MCESKFISISASVCRITVMQIATISISAIVKSNSQKIVVLSIQLLSKMEHFHLFGWLFGLSTGCFVHCNCEDNIEETISP
mmetsp:Transcript_29377/g.40365  ORF Transcript_29377/g.40365 Transcript_29377/m.40365 type:complete len:81 (-) Transcript_29377:541-783(-)